MRLLLLSLILLSACASAPVPPATVGSVQPAAEQPEQPDPNIHPLSQEVEEAGE